MTSTLHSPRSAGARQLVVGKHAALDTAPEPAFWGSASEIRAVDPHDRRKEFIVGLKGL